jgi:hypothetical protein
MKQLPKKLVVVGMRHIGGASQYVRDYLREGSVVILKQVDSEHGVNGRAFEVYAPEKMRKLGYIRNQDVPLLPNKEPYEIFEYKITTIRENYLVINHAYSTSDEHEITYRENPYLVGLDAYAAISSDTVNSHIFTDKIAKSNTVEKESSMITDKIAKSNTVEKESSMNTQNLRNQIFREVKNVVIDIQTGALGFQNKDGIATYVAGTISVNPIVDFGVKVPAFAMRVAVKDLKPGDIILQGDDASFYHSETEAGYEVLTLNGEVRQIGNVSNLFFGANTVLAVKNMFGNSGMNPMMMAMMMGEEKEGFDMKTFALMSMMGQNMGTGDSNMSQMMMMAMFMNK